MLIDSHCHFDFFSAERQAEFWVRMQAVGVTTMIIPAVSRETWEDVWQCSQRFPLFTAYGLHPIYRHQPADLVALQDWLATHEVVAVGECGLDYAVEIDRKEQQFFFEGQIELAVTFDLPLILHARGALEQVLQTVKRYPHARFVIHTFTGSDQQLAKIFELGGYIGIGGTSTYPRAQRLRRQLATVPSDRYILETDAPDQPLYGYQGRENTPALTAEVAKNLARLRGEPLEMIHRESMANCHRLFRLPVEHQ